MPSLRKKPRRILLYGFGPYREFHDNITARIVESLRPQPGLTKVVFPVSFHRTQFIEVIDRIKPAIILGLGQSSRQEIRVESQALNRRRARQTEKPRMISRTGPMRLKTTLNLKVGRAAGRSSNAGDYVCNFSMYVMLDHLRRNGLDIPYGFIHIPYDSDRTKAAELLGKILRDCQRITKIR